MYLGLMLFELGIVTTTLSIPAFLVWLFLFIAYNQFAIFEEKSLVNVLGEEYRGYMRKVKRWVIF
jgi:protein-S-isoprenylcysteine O-methyltransferase Ste14